MPRRLPRYCIEDVDRHGNIRIYLRRRKGAQKIRLEGIPFTPEFMAAYERALAIAEGQEAEPEQPPVRRGSRPGTWRWLCERYFASAEFMQLDPRTRKVRRNILEATFDEPTKPGGSNLFADFPLHLMTPKAIRLLRDRKQETPEAANGRVKAMRQVFTFGLASEPDHVKANPARDVPYFRTASDGFHTWTIEEVRQYEERHPVGSKARLALALLLYVGGRRADIPALGKQHIKSGWLRYTQNKNRNRNPVTLELPVLPPLQQVIDSTPSAREHLTFLVTEFGKPFTANGFGNWFKKRCVEAGLPHCTAHGLRKAGATIAAENGATERQLMAIFGWNNPKQAAHYTKKASQKRLAGGAMHLIDLGETENKRVPLSASE